MVDQYVTPKTTKSRIEYAEIVHAYRYLNGPKKGEQVRSYLAVGVWEDGKYVPINRGESVCEVEWFKKHGATVLMPHAEIVEHEQTPEEKWKRLTNPKTLDDFGLSLTEAELETFAEGREILAGMRQYTAELEDQCRMMAEFGQAAGEFIEQVCYGVLTVSALPPNAGDSFKAGQARNSGLAGGPLEASVMQQRLAWEIYCRETAGSMDVRDFWEELPPKVQAMFLSKATCKYPDCNCPFDAPANPNWCARGLPHNALAQADAACGVSPGAMGSAAG